MVKKFIISPPFGNYIRRSWATSVEGTYTLERRPGLIKQVIKTVRPTEGGWVNKIGFRNPGIKSVKKFRVDTIYSIAALEDGDWQKLYDQIPENTMVELNVSCPNVHEYSITYREIKAAADKFRWVSIKIPPLNQGLSLAMEAYWAGIRVVHMSNTVPTEKGGESGQKLKELVLPLIKELKFMIPDCTIIGGGGIYSPEDLQEYKDAGADHFSLATVWFTPWRMRKIKNA